MLSTFFKISEAESALVFYEWLWTLVCVYHCCVPVFPDGEQKCLANPGLITTQEFISTAVRILVCALFPSPLCSAISCLVFLHTHWGYTNLWLTHTHNTHSRASLTKLCRVLQWRPCEQTNPKQFPLLALNWLLTRDSFGKRRTSPFVPGLRDETNWVFREWQGRRRTPYARQTRRGTGWVQNPPSFPILTTSAIGLLCRMIQLPYFHTETQKPINLTSWHWNRSLHLCQRWGGMANNSSNGGERRKKKRFSFFCLRFGILYLHCSCSLFILL